MGPVLPIPVLRDLSEMPPVTGQQPVNEAPILAAPNASSP